METLRSLQPPNLKHISKSSMSHKLVLGRDSNREARTTEFKTGVYIIRRRKNLHSSTRKPPKLH